ncbi:Helicase SKI2W [Nymphon striatum]|nr:Helicase SKI2W [Nymphon striatum]
MDAVLENLNLIELGISGKVDLVPKSDHSEILCSTLPCGLPPLLPSLKEELEVYLLNPQNLPNHDLDEAQIFFDRKPDPLSLLNARLCPLNTTLQIDRDPITGRETGFTEVEINDDFGTSKTSTSLTRAPGPLSETTHGNSTNYPFWPGGLEETKLEDLKQIDNIDFDELETTPPGFEHGMDFKTNESRKNTISPTSIFKITDIMDDSDMIDFSDDESENEQSEEQTKISNPKIENVDDVDESLLKSAEIPVVKISEKVLSKPKSDYSEWTEVIDVSKPVEDFHKKIPQMAHKWNFELDTFQKQAILRLVNHDSVFVAAHTSAGKTVVAEYAIAMALKHMTRAIYTSPIKALSNQKFRDFSVKFDVGLLTGDVQLRPEASCLIMTTEILKSMLYKGSDVIRDLEWVIFDEVHYINDAERGVVWEEVLIMLPSHVNIILLSATVPNTVEFADWVGRTKKKKIYVISTQKRPVPLEHYLYTGNTGKTRNECFMLLDSSNNFLEAGECCQVGMPDQNTIAYTNSKPVSLHYLTLQALNNTTMVKEPSENKEDSRSYRKAITAKKERSSKMQQGFGAKGVRSGCNPGQEKNIYITLIEFLRQKDLLPVVSFTLSRKRCDNNAEMLTSVDLTTAAEKREIRLFTQKCLSKLKGPDKKIPQVNRLKGLLERGLAVHHSGILPILKEVVEMLFHSGLVKFLFATETFAMGVNMPTRTVVFDNIRKHDGVQNRDLLPGEYIQMAGRAGRRGHDTTGTVIILCKVDVPEKSDLHKMMLGKPTRLESRFRITYSMILNLLRVRQLKVVDMMKRSFNESGAQRNQPNIQEKLNSKLEELKNYRSVECGICKDDLKEFYGTCLKYFELNHNIWTKGLAPYPSLNKILCPGRVIVIYSTYVNEAKILLAMIVSSSSKIKNKALMVFVLGEDSSTDDWTENDNLYKFSDVPEKFKCIALTKNDIDSNQGKCRGYVADITYDDIVHVSSKILKIECEKVINDVKKREIPRFCNDPPNPSTMTATQELTALIKDYSNLSFVSVVEDFGFKDMDLVLNSKKLRTFLKDIKTAYKCTTCFSFQSHFEQSYKIFTDQLLVEELRFQLSDECLKHLQDYKCMLNVLNELQYIDNVKTVEMKGRVACEMGNHELMITELIYNNIFTQLPPEEIAALLSCLVFQLKSDNEPELNDSLKEGIIKVKAIATRIGEAQKAAGLAQPVGDFVDQFKFGLTEVVYKWAKGMSFQKITELTDVQEGIIVKCIQRLDETLKDVKNAARIVGDPVLSAKVVAASECIRRDIVFAASLYTQ